MKGVEIGFDEEDVVGGGKGSKKGVDIGGAKQGCTW